MTTKLNIAVAGIGTVGSGVIQNIFEKKTLFKQRTGIDIYITDISSRTKTGRSIDITPYKWHESPLDLVKTDADIIVETIGGEKGIAYDLIVASLKAGKHVITANKALLAHHGHELALLAEENNVSLKYEAAVAGGIPIIKALKEGLAANEYHQIYGILNGTCNYILTKMEKEGSAFKDVLKEAQDLGFAEADPTLDIGGFDAAHKITLLSSIAFGIQTDYENTQIEGIEAISSDDIAYAKRLGYVIRLFGIATLHDGKISQSVKPVLISPDKAGASVDGAYNAVITQNDYAEVSLIVGCGAGQKPTASAVVADILDIARNIHTPTFGIPAQELKKAQFISDQEASESYYIRLHIKDQEGALANVTSHLAEHHISVNHIIQENITSDKAREVVIITHETTKNIIDKAFNDICSLDEVESKPTILSIFQ